MTSSVLSVIFILLGLLVGGATYATLSGSHFELIGGVSMTALIALNFLLLVPVSIRRCRDTGLPGWVYPGTIVTSILLSFIPVISVLGGLTWCILSLWLAFGPTRNMRKKWDVQE